MENKDQLFRLWSPIDNIPDRLVLDSIVDGREGLRVILAEDFSSNERLVIHFDIRDVIGYKVSNDSYTWRSDSSRLREKICALNLVENSNYLRWFADETYGTVDFSGSRHYCLLLVEEAIDIAAMEPPKVYFATV